MDSPSDETYAKFSRRLQRLREADSVAVREFVAQYDPYIRRAIRLKLNRHSLQPVADSCDVCQSVMGSFLLRLSAGEYEVDCELQLKKLLTSILKNKFQMLLRREMAAKRDRNRTKSFEDQGTIADPHAVEPRDSISIQELQQQAFAKLTDHEKQLLKLRMEGLSWELIAQRLELDERLLRKRLSRAINRVSLELGLIPDDESDEQQ